MVVARSSLTLIRNIMPYDEFLAPKIKDGSSIQEAKRFYNKEGFLTKHLNTLATVVHLHGSFCNPTS